MLVPCIDLMGGKAVQLEGGRKLLLEVADVFGLLKRFARYPVIHVIDLDAALGRRSNARLVKELCKRSAMRVRVGGGIRTVARATQILRWGADQVIVGSAAFRRGRVNHTFLTKLAKKAGRRRILLALDADRGRIVVRGWRKKLRLKPEGVMTELEPYCSEFLCTCVEREGRMQGTNLAWFRKLRRATRLPITAAGGIRSRREVRALERLGMDAAVGLALYRNILS